MNIGDLIKFVPKNYSSSGGPFIRDQWAGLIGIILEKSERDYIIYVQHPLDSAPTEVIAFKGDVVPAG
jgi:hypothetical protein